MVSLRYFILCNLASMDQKGRLTCQGFFDSWGVSDLPSSLESFYLVLGIDGLAAGEKATLYLSMKTPDGALIGDKQRINVKSTDNTAPVVCMFAMHKFPATQLGIYQFEISHRNKVVGKYPFRIYQLEGGN